MLPPVIEHLGPQTQTGNDQEDLPFIQRYAIPLTRHTGHTRYPGYAARHRTTPKIPLIPLVNAMNIPCTVISRIILWIIRAAAAR